MRRCRCRADRKFRSSVHSKAWKLNNADARRSPRPLRRAATENPNSFPILCSGLERHCGIVLSEYKNSWIRSEKSPASQSSWNARRCILPGADPVVHYLSCRCRACHAISPVWPLLRVLHCQRYRALLRKGAGCPRNCNDDVRARVAPLQTDATLDRNLSWPVLSSPVRRHVTIDAEAPPYATPLERRSISKTS